MAGRILVNSSWNFAAFAVSVLANFLAIPFVVRTIGLTAFGEAGLLLAVFAPMSLIGTVMGQAIIHATSARKTHEGADSTGDALWTAVVLTLASCSVVTTVFCAAIHGADQLLAAHGLVLADASMPLVIGLGWTAQQLALVLQSAFAGAQRYADIAVATVAATVLNVGAIVVVTWLHPNAMGYASGMCIGFGLTFVTWTAWTVADFPGALRWRKLSAAQARAIYDFGLWQSIAFLVGTGAAQADRYLLGIWSPLKTVGQYSVAVRLQEVVSMAVLKISEVLFPYFGATHADDAERRATFFVTASWVVGTVSVVVMMPLMPLAHSLISMWVNAEAANAGAPVLHLLLSAAALGAGATVYIYQALGTGRSTELAALNIVQAVCIVAIAVPMVWAFGIEGAGIGMTAANALRLLACWLLVSRNFEGHMPVSRLLQAAGSPIVAGLSGGWLITAWWHPQPSNWGAFIVFYAALAIATLAVVLAATCAHAVGRSLLSTMRLRLVPSV